MTIDEQIALLRRGTTEIIGEDDLRRKLGEGKVLRVKLGVDPTAAHVTLGWAVVLRKLRDFQRLGHTACLIIGDFTAMIGDPSGKSKTRKQLTREEVQANVDAVSSQIYKILDPEKTEIYFNKDWLGSMGFEDVIRLCSRYTVARIMERDDFTKRWENHQPIAMHEILYPLCQGMDSVEIKSDVELGGNDQKFNNLVGRTLMEQYGLEPQSVILSPLLVGTDGTEKMSQSLGNYVSVVDTPNDMFGKTMSIPDELIENWFELCTDVPMDEVKSMLEPGKNPRDAKIRLAKEIVALYHSVEDADGAERFFIETFSQRKQVTDAPEFVIDREAFSGGGFGGGLPISYLVTLVGGADSRGSAKKLIQAGAVSLDGEKVGDVGALFGAADLDGKILRVGKKLFLKLVCG
jgi:tyrosyl-tRNA synthetase